MKTIEQWFGIMCLAIMCGWFFGLRMMGAEQWLPSCYQMGYWGDMVVACTLLASLLSRDVPMSAFVIHGLLAAAIWYLPGLVYILDRIAEFPDAARGTVQHLVAASMLLLSALSLADALDRRKKRRCCINLA